MFLMSNVYNPFDFLKESSSSEASNQVPVNNSQAPEKVCY